MSFIQHSIFNGQYYWDNIFPESRIPRLDIYSDYGKSGSRQSHDTDHSPALYLGGLLLQPVDKLSGRVYDTPLPREAGQRPQPLTAPHKPDTRSRGCLILRRYFHKIAL